MPCAFEKDHLGKISPSEDALLQQVPQLKGCFLEIYCSKYKRPFNVIFPYLTLESKFSNAWKYAVEYWVLLFTDWAQMMCLHLREQSHLLHYL